MAEFGITAYGAYAPRLRLQRSAIAEAHKWMAPSLKSQAKGTRAFCSWDEDIVTMAVEAGRDALPEGAIDTLDALYLATTRAPYADLQASAIVAGALRAPNRLHALDIANSQRAGTSGMLMALQASRNGLFIASDAPVGRPASTQELSYGAGAAAFSLGTGKVIARLLGASSVTDMFVDHFRASGAKFDYFWEERWVRDEGYAKLAPQAIKAALTEAGLGIDAITTFAMPSLFRGAADAVAKKIKFAGTMAPSLEDGIGYAGTAHAPMMLAAALEQAKSGDRILLVGFGQGADAMIFEVTDAITEFAPRRGISGVLDDAIVTDSYMRMLSFADGIDLEWGMRSEKNGKTALTEQERSSSQIEGFVAGRCGVCATVQFPQLQACVSCHAPATQFVPVPLADEPAQVLTTTADWLSYHPAPPLHVGFVQFDNGARLIMETVDVGPEGIDNGAPLRMVFRIKERDKARGYSRYFWKSTPIRSA